MKALCLCWPLLLLLAGCQTLGWPSATAADDSVEICITPSALPALDDSEETRLGWLAVADDVAARPPLTAWRALADYRVGDDSRARLIAALVTSRADMPDALRQLGQQSLNDANRPLPASVRPLFDRLQRYNTAILNQHQQQRRLSAAQARIVELEAALAERQRQLDALTAIESQLHNESLDGPRSRIQTNPGESDER
ncbi:hypothetical protein [Saccharospirillum mangrovi]|uniref:hypothetical protein n=1 Tax=Saccharospirillum mangrovi TaxID=2161747 RepID=UPI000D397F68|nr:hypothetical protein [Saccharospirillum mangrovi]